MEWRSPGMHARSPHGMDLAGQHGWNTSTHAASRPPASALARNPRAAIRVIRASVSAATITAAPPRVTIAIRSWPGSATATHNMSLVALSLVLASAFGHATWNYWLKTRGGGVVFVWLFSVTGCAIYLPLAAALVWFTGFVPTAAQLGLMLASGLLHTAYYLLLDRGYRGGDLSLVYPIARATGPLLTLVAAIAVIGERPSSAGLIGALTIVAGAFLLTGGARLWRADGHWHALGYALASGFMLTAFTLNDRHAVAVLLVPPLIHDWAQNLVRAVLLTPLAYTQRQAIGALWRDKRTAILIIAVLCPASYILVLAAMQLAPISYVAAARELSILFGTLMGARLLREADSHRRVTGAIVMLGGFIALALA